MTYSLLDVLGSLFRFGGTAADLLTFQQDVGQTALAVRGGGDSGGGDQQQGQVGGRDQGPMMEEEVVLEEEEPDSFGKPRHPFTMSSEEFDR